MDKAHRIVRVCRVPYRFLVVCRIHDMAHTDEAGINVTVTWGKQTYYPIKYNGFEIGPFSASMTVDTEEEIVPTMNRLNDEIEKAATQMFMKQRVAYFQRLDSLRN